VVVRFYTKIQVFWDVTLYKWYRQHDESLLEGMDECKDK
jgi:hypothetical protein